MGDLGVGFFLSLGMDFALDGKLYGLDNFGTIVKIDPSDGSTTSMGATTFKWISATSAPEDATPPGSPIPEPTTIAVWSLLCLITVSAVYLRRRNRVAA